jgi:NodT family efflux transporter outer membrane factor (OMF) lipoprotein
MDGRLAAKERKCALCVLSRLFLAVAAVFAGCAVGPNYTTPKVKVEPGFGELGNTTGINPAAQPSRATGQAAPVAEWWRVFGDPQLDRLIDEAVRENYGLQIATARIRQARAQRGIAAADLFPDINANAGYNRARGSKNLVLPFGASAASSRSGGSSSSAGSTGKSRSGGTSADPPGDPPASGSVSSSGTGTAASSSASRPPIPPFGGGGLPGVTTELYQIGFDANWELDIFGGTRRRIEAATADLAASVESRRDVLVTLLAEVARNYLELRGTQERLAVARENLAAQRQTVELTRSMYKSGLTSELDVARAAAQAATTASTIPPLEAQVRQSIHALSTLLGKEPNTLSAELTQASPLPPVPPQVPVGLPSELLRRRPDIRQAERQIAAATARIGSAKADLYPKFAITGSVGLDSSSLSQLLNASSRYFLINPTVSWPLFDAGRIRSNIALQKANRQEALLQYRNSILSALREVEDALAAYTTQQARRTALAEALGQSRQALELAQDQYQHGLADFLTVLDAQRSVLAAQDTLAQSSQTVCTDLVALYKALGGGWTIEAEQGKTK